MSDSKIAVSNLTKEFYFPRGHNSNAAINIRPINNLSFQVNEGEVLGIIGKNGAGKSTLLKILSGITRPTSGTVKLFGTTTSILDIGSNMYPELSGYDNAKMHLRIKGISLSKNQKLLDTIHQFSGIGDFFYQPAKFYSDGMLLRLAFSIAYNTLSDILILDEVLSVGDESFKMKSFDFIKKLKDEGKTIVLVSHSRQEIMELCSRCIWLHNGEIKMDDTAATVMPEYFEEQKEIFTLEQNRHSVVENGHGTIGINWTADNAPGADEIRLLQFNVFAEGHSSLFTSESITLQLLIDKRQADISLNCGIIFNDRFLQPVFFISSLNSPQFLSHRQGFKGQSGLFHLSCTIPANILNEGTYYLSLRFGKDTEEGKADHPEVFRLDNAFKIVIKNPPERYSFVGKEMNASILPFLDWEYRKTNSSPHE